LLAFEGEQAGYRTDLAGLDPDGDASYSTDLSGWTAIGPGAPMTLLEVVDSSTEDGEELIGLDESGALWAADLVADDWTPIPGVLECVVGGDFDGDTRRDDLAGINFAGGLEYTLDRATRTAITGDANRILAGDVDNDGVENLIRITDLSEVRSTGDFASWTQIPGILDQLVVGDFDNDGQVDDLAGLTASGAVFYTTDLTNWTRIPGVMMSLLCGDLDGDGYKDDLIGLNAGGKISYTTNLTTWKGIPHSPIP
jgi:hypothetical protein